MVYDRLLTNKARLDRNMSLDSECKACCHPVRDAIPLLRDCAFFGAILGRQRGNFAKNPRDKKAADDRPKEV